MARRRGRRFRREQPGVHAPTEAVPTERLGAHHGPTPPYDPLSHADIEAIVDATLQVMEEAGVGFAPHSRAWKLFREAGCTISDDGVVQFPPAVVRDALARMPKSVELWNRRGDNCLLLDRRHTWFIPGMTCIRYDDPDSGEQRDGTGEDLATITRIADALPNMDAVTVTCKDTTRPDMAGEVNEFAIIAANTTKPLEYLCEQPESLRAVVDIAAAIRGGHERLREKPYFLHLVTPLPLYYDTIHTEQILDAVDTGVPLGMGTVTIGGASAPITMAGCIVHSLATDFAGMVLAQLARPGAFCIGGSDASFMEVATGGIGAFPQTSLGDMAMCQIARHLDYPSLTGIAGCTVARRFNQDAVWEISSSMMQTFYSRPATCDYVGSIDEGMTYSLHALLLCDELAGMLRRMWAGIPVDHDTLAIDLTLQEGPRGDYLAQEHTARHCRIETWSARYLGARIPVSSGGETDRELIERIDEHLHELSATHHPEPLDPTVQAAMADVQMRFESEHGGAR